MRREQVANATAGGTAVRELCTNSNPITQRHDNVACPIPVLAGALDLLEALKSFPQGIVLQRLHELLAVPKSTAFRILRTLEHRGYVVRDAGGRYRSAGGKPRKYRIAVLWGESGHGVIRAHHDLLLKANDSGIELISLDVSGPCFEGKAQAEALTNMGIDAVVLYRCRHDAMFVLAERLRVGRIPSVAVDIVQPHSVFVGVNDFRVGADLGRLLGAYIASAASLKLPQIIALYPGPQRGPASVRTGGAWVGLSQEAPWFPCERFIRFRGCISERTMEGKVEAMIGQAYDVEETILLCMTELATRKAILMVGATGCSKLRVVGVQETRSLSVENLLARYLA